MNKLKYEILAKIIVKELKPIGDKLDSIYCDHNNCDHNNCDCYSSDHLEGMIENILDKINDKFVIYYK